MHIRIQSRKRPLTKKLYRLAQGLVKYVQLQLFLTLFSWPILTWWGLPFSYASIVGNLIFTPFLTGFLLLASLIFFCELLFLPATPFIWLLDQLTNTWTFLLSFGSRSWLVAYAQPPLIGALAIPIVACILLQHKKLISPFKSIIALFAFTLITAGTLKTCFYCKDPLTHIPCFSQELIILRSERTSALLDPGSLGRRISAPSWVRYTLLPTLIKQGTMKLDIVLCTRPSTMTFHALIALCEAIEVKDLYIPNWRGHLKNMGWSAWEKLLITAHKYGTTLHLITQDCSIACGARTINVHQEKKLTRKNKLAYYALRIEY